MTNLSLRKLAEGVEYRQATAVKVNVNAPVGGWNTRDSFDDIPPTDAIVMDNWIPKLGAVKVRGGSTLHCDLGITERVESLMVFRSGVDEDMIAAADGQLWDVSTKGAPVAIGTNDYTYNTWDSTNFAGLLIMVNGAESLQWSGSVLQPIQPNLPPGPTAPVGVHSFKNRNYYWDALAQSFWYTELYAPGGTTTEFDISRYVPRGGHIVGIETWTHDGGTGPDDHLVIILSSGTVVVYQGTSPATISDWALVGLYNIGTPVGNRCTVKYGGDLMIITTLDIVPMSQIMTGREATQALSKISGAMEDAAYFSGQFGWDAELYPREKLILFNIPINPPKEIYQYVMNTITGAWARLVDWEAYCWVEFENDLFFGSSDGIVKEAFSGSVDYVDDATPAAPVESLLQSAWLTFGTHETKQLQAIRPVFRKVGASNAVFAFAVNFQSFPYLAFPVNEGTYGSPWGLTDPPYVGYPGVPWGSPWGFALGIDQDWRIAEGVGKYIGLQMKMTTSSPTELAGILWMLEAGTNL